jgi:hypothetical protein
MYQNMTWMRRRLAVSAAVLLLVKFHSREKTATLAFVPPIPPTSRSLFISNVVPPKKGTIPAGLLFATSAKMNDTSTPDEDEEAIAGRVASVEQTVPSLVQGTTRDDDITSDGLCVGSTVIAKTTIPSLGIWQFQSYELQSIFDQGSADNGVTANRISVRALTAPRSKPGYTRYITLYSSKYHQAQGPITLTPEEVGLVSVKDEVLDSLLWALPLFGFWLAVAVSFANLYNDRYGGNWIDALFRT